MRHPSGEIATIVCALMRAEPETLVGPALRSRFHIAEHAPLARFIGPPRGERLIRFSGQSIEKRQEDRAMPSCQGQSLYVLCRARKTSH
jgi:hypothetical protein